MLDSLAGLAVQGGPWGLIGLTIVAIIRGWLIPRRTHQERVTDLKQQAEDWRAAYQSEQKVSAEKDKQIAILLGRPKEN